MDPAEEAFDKTMRLGERTTYKPDLALESIRQFVPATPSTADGRRATVLQNLSVLGTADPVGMPQLLQQQSYADDLARSGVRFFADAAGREAAETFLKQGSGGTVQSAEESVRSIIFDRAVAGKHERPQFAETPAQISRSWHLRSETYTMADVEKFDKKLGMLVKPAAKTASKPKKTPTTKAKKPEANAEAKA